MPPAPKPVDECARLMAVRADPTTVGTADAWSDSIVGIAATLTGCPIALVSIVDEERQWFRGCRGLPVRETTRDVSFCAYAVYSRKMLVVEDARKDERFADNALVTGPPGIRGYAGVPVYGAGGQPLGTLCVIDTVPRKFSAEQLTSLSALAGMVSERLQLEARARAAERGWARQRDEASELSSDKSRLESDVARREALEESLREQAAARAAADRLSKHKQAALEAAGIVAITDAKGTILHVNENFCRISGYSAVELLGQNHRLLNSGHHPKSFFTEMFSTIASGRPWRAEVCNRGKNGKLYWVDTAIVPMVGEGGKIEQYLALRIDITANVENTRALERQRAELAEARERADAASRAKSEFLANMSHEIRTPLTAILGYADMLREEGDLSAAPPARLQTLDTIRSAGQHLLTVINDILDLSKIEAGRMTVESVEASVAGLMAEVASLVRPRAAGKGVELHVGLETAVPEKIHCDPTRLRQVMMNLAGNAAKFTEQGRIDLTARVDHGPNGDRLVIAVEDTGVGLTLEQAGQLFAAFAQADTKVTRRFGGTGLGLVISRRLAELMGGTVRLVRSEEGKGSRFEAEIPLLPVEGSAMLEQLEKVMVPAIKLEAAVAVRLSGRILLAEDGKDNQRLISWHLTNAGATVVVVDDGQQALDKLDAASSAGEPFDLLVTDMQMPVMDGYSLARQLRGRGSDLPVIALTAHAMAEDRAKCLEAGCDDYATKPIDKLALLGVCAKWMAARSERARRAA